MQENAFKKGTTLALDEHRGNCGRMVANVAVITELERLAARTQRDESALEELTSQEAALTDSAALASQQDQRARKKLTTQRSQLDALIEQGRTQGKAWLAANSHRIELFRLPAYSPNLNGIEGAWKETKKRTTHNRFFHTTQERDDALIETFETFKAQSSLLAGLVARFL